MLSDRKTVEQCDDRVAFSHQLTGFQVKAENFTAAKVSNEMFPGGAVRAAFLELDQSGGTYVIASSKASVSDVRLRERQDAMRAAADQHGLRRLNVEFYGPRAIASWVNSHHGLVPWVRARAGRPAVGWQSYGPWAYMEKDQPLIFGPSAIKSFHDKDLALPKLGNLGVVCSQPKSFHQFEAIIFVLYAVRQVNRA